jgi:hypothetical protein
MRFLTIAAAATLLMLPATAPVAACELDAFAAEAQSPALIAAAPCDPGAFRRRKEGGRQEAREKGGEEAFEERKGRIYARGALAVSARRNLPRSR